MISVVVKSLILLITIQLVFSKKTTTPALDCLIPNYPSLQNLELRLHPHNQTLELGAHVADFETIHVTCKNDQIRRGTSSMFCRNGEFNEDFPTCENYCDGTLLNKLSLRAICDYNDMFVRCPKNIPSGTFIQVACSYNYFREPNTRQYLRCLPNGNFDKLPQRCEPSCGRIAHAVESLTKSGTEIKISVAPWHVAIYRKNNAQYNYRCAGSIISPTVVISVAHCFWDEANFLLDSLANYQVIAGHNSRGNSTEQTEYAQVIKVKEVHIPEEYVGKSRMQEDDIAILILEQPFKYSESVTPICFPKMFQNTATSYMLSGRDGFISIFGKNNQLESVPVKTLMYHDCAAEAPLAADKFCIYATNNTRDVSWTSNSGAGFAITSRDPFTDTVTYKMQGVLSHSMHSKNANTSIPARFAITSIHMTRPSFQRKVLSAIKADETLF